MGEKKNAKRGQMTKNIAMNVLAFAIQLVINFYISPTIVSGVGTEAYGFIGLANDFTSYASVVTTVFNSVAARFIAASYYQRDYEQANRYFNSLIVANLIMAGALGIVGAALVPCLDLFLEIPAAILSDVKLTFALVFGAYILNLVTTVFTASVFVSNRTDIQGVRNIINQIVRLAAIVFFFFFFSLRSYWIALATLIAGVVVAVMNVSLTKTLTPQLTIAPRTYARKKDAFTLAKSGGWMAFTSLSNVLMRGLDLVIANLCIGASAMGILSVARTFPNQITAVIGTIAPLFTPVFVALYARSQTEELVRSVKSSIQTMAILLFVPICGFLVFSSEFYTLWQPELSAEEIGTVSLLSSVTAIQAYFNASTATMAQLSIVTDKLKLPVFISCGCGIVNIVLVLVLIYCTNLGVLAIALSGTTIMILRYVIFNAMYAAWCLGVSKRTFLWQTVKTWLAVPVLTGWMWLIKYLLPVTSWGGLILDAVICASVGYLLMVCVYRFGAIKRIIGKIFKKQDSGEKR